MFRLLGWLRHFAAAEYWRNRARNAEALLEVETMRNREREDTFVSATVMGGRNMWGVPPRSGPAMMKQVGASSVATDPIQTLTPLERTEFYTQYLEDARRAGIPDKQALSDFLRDVASRKQSNEEPLM